MIKSYSIHVNRTNKRVNKIAVILLGVAVLGFWGLGFIQPFIQIITSDLSPKSINNGIGFIFFLGLVSLLLLAIKSNEKGCLMLYEDYIEVKSSSPVFRVYFKDLKKISFVVATITFKPYRVEFIYPDGQLKRVRLQTKEEFYDLMNYLYEVSPKELEKDVSAFESEEQ
ncbi:hypothetical protein HUW51_15320 [Adhaeribacter swui]|uniref:Uncharacterized protein n=1 Tax=Adhaeribacter swui TaxID=2086471 RepID=A0A7G7GA39_9BACT|nr:hypothetical protein [Adhaeribacter swui]QNF34023.1 hypothetical protein HUW51_15320 [Adhaeribacter swui]